MTTRRPGTPKPSYLLCLGSLHEGYLHSPLSGHLRLPSTVSREKSRIYGKEDLLPGPKCETKPSQETFLSPFTTELCTPHTFSAAPVSSWQQHSG